MIKTIDMIQREIIMEGIVSHLTFLIQLFYQKNQNCLSTSQSHASNSSLGELEKTKSLMKMYAQLVILVTLNGKKNACFFI